MKEFKKNDKVILNPPINLNPSYTKLHGREATVMGYSHKIDDMVWYKLLTDDGISLTLPARWLKEK